MVEGFGLGLRPAHFRDFADGRPVVDWLEVLSENYLVPGGKPLDFLDRIRARYPMGLDWVALSIAGTDPRAARNLAALRALADRIEPAWISDHLCWTGVGAARLHDLLPVPFTEEALDHVARRVHAVQEALRRELVLENVSSYVAWPGGAMTEWDFIAGLVARTGCGVLLDVNNVYVSAVNHGFDPHEYLAAVPAAAVRQIHLAGHTIQGTKLVDTHDAAVRDEVWSLYEEAIALLGPRPTMIERDGNIPPLAELLDELDIARRLARRALDGGSGHALAA
jgi:uncharacterized protein (UPF0276 family)